MFVEIWISSKGYSLQQIFGVLLKWNTEKCPEEGYTDGFKWPILGYSRPLVRRLGMYVYHWKGTAGDRWTEKILSGEGEL